MIEEFTAKGYGCLRDVTVKLTPLHAFIGPNDSGKSTLLKAVRTLCVVASRRVGVLETDVVVSDVFLRGVLDGGRALSLETKTADASKYTFSWNAGWAEAIEVGGSTALKAASGPSYLHVRQPHDQYRSLRVSLSGARMVRLRPEELRHPTQRLDGASQLQFLTDHGLGLGAVLDAIRDRNEDAWRALIVDVQRHFPNVRRLQLRVKDGGKVIAAELLDGTRVGVDELSEGFLYYLAFAAMQHFDPVAVLCVEEPENGLHPARIREVVRILRAISAAGTQVLLTTHSPLLVNELLPTETTVLTRPKDGGTVATRLADVPLYRERIERDALLPGEFWASYCDGEFEEPLLHPVPLET